MFSKMHYFVVFLLELLVCVFLFFVFSYQILVFVFFKNSKNRNSKTPPGFLGNIF